MFLLIATIPLPLVSSCLLLSKCGLVINLVGTHRGIVSHVGTLETLDVSVLDRRVLNQRVKMYCVSLSRMVMQRDTRFILAQAIGALCPV